MTATPHLPPCRASRPAHGAGLLLRSPWPLPCSPSRSRWASGPFTDPRPRLPRQGPSVGEAGRGAVAGGGVAGAGAPADAPRAPRHRPPTRASVGRSAGHRPGGRGRGHRVEDRAVRLARDQGQRPDGVSSPRPRHRHRCRRSGHVRERRHGSRPDGWADGPRRRRPAARVGTSVPDVGVDEARMVLSVPAKALDDVLTQLSKIGSVSYRSSQSQDVTDSYIDTKARIQPMRDGIDRVRALLAKTTDLQQVITLESELSRRQADLDSLEQRLAKLDAMTTTSDVTVDALDRRDHAGADRERDHRWPAHGVGQPPRLRHGHPHRARRAPAVARPARAAHPAGPAGVASPRRRYAVRDLPHGR